MGDDPDTRRSEKAAERGTTLALAGAGALLVACCLGPVLLAGVFAGGALGALAGLWARLDPLWIAALAVAGAALVGLWRRRRVAGRTCDAGVRDAR